MATTSAPVMVRNTHPGPTVFTYGKSAEDFVEWFGAGDPAGGDIQAVPADLLNNVQFRRSLVRGILVVEEDEQLGQMTELAHRTDWEDRQEAQFAAGKEFLVEEQQNDLILVKCIAPARQGSGKLCATELSVRTNERYSKPPLCTEHQFLGTQYVPENTGRLVGNQEEIIWKKISLAPKARQKAQPVNPAPTTYRDQEEV